MAKKIQSGPFQVIDTCTHEGTIRPEEAPKRKFTCTNYETCLNVAAALNWDNFTCRGCEGEINQHLLWQARVAQRMDNIAKKVCELPLTSVIESDIPEPLTTSKKVVA